MAIRYDLEAGATTEAPGTLCVCMSVGACSACKASTAKQPDNNNCTNYEHASDTLLSALCGVDNRRTKIESHLSAKSKMISQCSSVE